MRRTPSSLDEVADVLALQVPRAAARAAVKQVAQARGLSDTDLTVEEVLLLLDALATNGGTIGVCARFAKARVLLAAGLVAPPTERTGSAGGGARRGGVSGQPER